MVANQKSYIVFRSPDEVGEWIRNSYTQDQLDAFDMKLHMQDPISDYKGSAYRWMNSVVRANLIEKYNDIDIGGLQRKLWQMRIPSDICATRFVDLKEYSILLKGTAFGNVFRYNSFLSTTLLKDYYAMGEIRHHRLPIKVYIPSGTPGMYLPEVNPCRPEFEILMPYGLNLEKLCLNAFIVRQ